jgi:adenylate cyclase
MPSRAPFRRFFWIVLFGGLIGALYADARHGAPAAGALVGASTGAVLFSLERIVLRRNSGALFRRLPFLSYLGLRSLLYAGVILLVSAVVNWLLAPGSQFAAFDRADFLFSLVLVIGGNLLFGVNDLLGPGVLFAFVAGRYYHPRIEERVLLFIDMRSSTAIAERLGELAYHSQKIRCETYLKALP